MGSKNFQNNTMFVLLCFAIALVCSVFGFTFSNFLFIFTISIIFVMKICRKLFRNVHGAIIIIKWLGFFRFFSFFLYFFSLLSLDGGGFYISTFILLPLTFTAAFRFRFLYNFQLRLSRTYRECFVERSSEPKQYVSCNETPSSIYAALG